MKDEMGTMKDEWMPFPKRVPGSVNIDATFAEPKHDPDRYTGERILERLDEGIENASITPPYGAPTAHEILCAINLIAEREEVFRRRIWDKLFDKFEADPRTHRLILPMRIRSEFPPPPESYADSVVFSAYVYGELYCVEKMSMDQIFDPNNQYPITNNRDRREPS